mmetsp:Transcript_14015/g.19465  ORF Transcript_14015/g.19465 Transcript_14015/m.19465 type:complete len:135 (+) Transcript_14015:740-1144(+)
MHPTYHVPKTYLVGVQSNVNSFDVDKLLRGISLKDPRSGKTRLARAIDIVVEEEEEVSTIAGVTCRVKMTITEGMNRQIRRMFSSLGKEVVELKRVSMGPLLLPDTLAPGEVSILTDAQIGELRAAVGLDIIFE